MGRMIQLSHHSSACLAYFHREHSDNQRAGEARPHLFQQKHRCLRLVSHHLSIILCSPLWLYHTVMYLVMLSLPVNATSTVCVYDY